jgi:glycosyltransferase involved in cell wall biosynthesis
VNYSKITVITPSFNQGQYIEQTILSVIGQCYPNLEYIIIDGGSTDGTVDIIKKYENDVTFWVSGKDAGQSDAINKGFAMGTGDILCWLNSDDYYLPGTLLAVNRKLDTEKPELVHGNCVHLNEADNFTHGSYFDPFENLDIYEGSFINQPSSFWTKKAFELAGGLRVDLHFGFDWEWYARAFTNGVRFIPANNYFSVYRLHSGQKSATSDLSRFKELLEIGGHLKPGKYNFLNGYIPVHKKGIRFIFKLTDRLHLHRLEYRLLKLFYPGLMQSIDRVSLRTYLKLLDN